MKSLLMGLTLTLTTTTAFAVTIQTPILYKGQVMKVTAMRVDGEHALSNIALTPASGSSKTFGIAASSNEKIKAAIGALLCAELGKELNSLNPKLAKNYVVSSVDTGGYHSNIQASGLLEVAPTAAVSQGEGILVENDEDTFRGVRCELAE